MLRHAATRGSQFSGGVWEGEMCIRDRLFAIPFREQMGRAKSVPDDRYTAVYADMAREMEEQIADIAARGGAEE